ncbi:ATP-binding protein [Streptomyces sp. NPDC046985]|uniref:ATP-binding protein n=1 Tax=Streptomyces sp. NPDC046985 TaxID=3155377 RepID=UPI0033EB1B78
MTPALAMQEGNAPRSGFELSIGRRPNHDGSGLSSVDAKWPGRCRRIVRAALNLWRQTGLADTAELLTSELVTNALQHGAGPDVGMRLYLTAHHLVLEVRDGSTGRPVVRQAQPDDEHGRGLALVEALSDAWGTSPDGTRTWCALALTPCEGPTRMQPAAANAPVLGSLTPLRLPGDPGAATCARAYARQALALMRWDGPIDAAAVVVGHLAANAVQHGVMPGHPGERVTLELRIEEEGRLLVDVTDPNPEFGDFEAAQKG